MWTPLTIACGLVTLVIAARDPTTVCFPPVYQTDLYDFDRGDTGVVAFDRTRGLIGIEYTNSGRVVHNVTSGKEYGIYANGTCYVSDMPLDLTMFGASECLPDIVKPLTNATEIIGLPSIGVSIEGYELDITADVYVRLLVTTDDPAVLVVRHFKAPTRQDVSFYVNPQMSIDNPLVFDIPTGCVPV